MPIATMGYSVTVWSDAVTHANEAMSDGKVIVIELKESKPMMQKK